MNMLGSAIWRGSFKHGTGSVSTESGALSHQPFDVSSRFGLGDYTNPEELIAAGHAACFSMAFSHRLQEAGLIAEEIDTTADVTLSKIGNEFEITGVHLILKAKIPNVTQEAFDLCAESAKVSCPVSKLFQTRISLDARLVDLVA